MIGLAYAALRLAENRRGLGFGAYTRWLNYGFGVGLGFPTREQASRLPESIAFEYYAIIDRMSRGEKP